MRYDFIVVGGGTAGAALASRLSEDEDRQVLLLEAGPDHVNLDEGDMLTNPMTFAQALTAWDLQATVTSGRTLDYAQGKMIGGGSSVNGALAIRGLPEDYDGWSATGNKGWSWNDLLPYFTRMESDTGGAERTHGSNGPLPIVRSQQSELVPLQQGFLRAAEELGFSWADDHNSASTTGIGPFPMNRRGQARVSTALSYLADARNRPNLTVRADTLVSRVLVEECVAVGVEAAWGGHPEVIEADRVVLCAGAIQSPALLWRSGIGPFAELRDLSIDCQVDNPAVGKNLMDHPGSLIFLSPSAPHLCEPTGPAYQLGIRWTSQNGAFNDMLTGLMNYWDTRADPGLREAAESDYIFALTCGLHAPYSRGEITLTSPDPTASPSIDFAMLKDQADIRRMLEGLRFLHRIARSSAMEGMVDKLLFIEDATFEDDDDLVEYLNATASGWYHACGTCRMGSDQEAGAVVSPQLSVHGVEKLYVADASIIPTIPRAPTNLTVLAIAEKASDMLRCR